MIDNFFKYDPVEDFLFSLITFFSKRKKELNTPDINLRCRCTGKMMIVDKSNKGLHLFCLRCFTVWIKPKMGLYYRESDIAKRAKGYRKILKHRN
jgi:hypothetical protein